MAQNAAWSAVALLETPEPEPVFCPTGFGVYLRRITSAEADATSAAVRCVNGGIQWAHLMVESSDGYVTSPSTRSLWAKIFREHGIRLGVWSFPGDARAASVEASNSAAMLLCEAADAIEAESIMLNIEEPYKGKAEQMSALCSQTLHMAPAASFVGVVSYPIPSYHPTLNWDAITGFDFGSPMFYTTAADPVAVNRGVSEWSKLVPQIAPSLDGWSGTGAEGASRFRQDIIRVCGEPPARLPGAIVWSESQMDDAKRAVTRDMAAKYSWPTP